MENYKFKVGDKVKAKEGCTNDLACGEGVVEYFNGNDLMRIRLTKESKGYEIGSLTSLNTWGNDVELVEASNYKPQKPTHLVVWEEERDPCKFFTSEQAAKDFIKELSEKSSVKKESIVLVEIKSCKKVNIQKSLRYTEHKI